MSEAMTKQFAIGAQSYGGGGSETTELLEIFERYGGQLLHSCLSSLAPIFQRTGLSKKNMLDIFIALHLLRMVDDEVYVTYRDLATAYDARMRSSTGHDYLVEQLWAARVQQRAIRCIAKLERVKGKCCGGDNETARCSAT